jgi:hypothetical protein
MKKIFSISFALLIILSGMHFSIATHTCGGKVAAVKWSFSGEKATCGMENPKQTCPTHKGVSSNCCRNDVVVYTVDNNYNSSSFQVKEIAKNLLQVFANPVRFLSFSFSAPISLNIIGSPPHNPMASAVFLSNICIFRI